MTKDEIIKKLEEEIKNLKKENAEIKYEVYKCSERVLNNR